MMSANCNPQSFLHSQPLWKTGDYYTDIIFQSCHPGVANDVTAHSGRILAMTDDFNDLLVESGMFDHNDFKAENFCSTFGLVLVR